jgi:hypothetical protein
MINQLLKELKDTWGYETEELNDIREKMEEVSNSSFWEGYNDRSNEDDLPYPAGFTAYGRREDFE